MTEHEPSTPPGTMLDMYEDSHRRSSEINRNKPIANRAILSRSFCSNFGEKNMQNAKCATKAQISEPNNKQEQKIYVNIIY